MNFIIVENHYADLESIHDDFCKDYLLSNELSNQEIRKKYNLTMSEFNEISKQVKKEHGLTRRPSKQQAKYYYKNKNRCIIHKWINNRMVHLGSVPNPEIAEAIVKMCIEAEWDVPTCKELVRNWRCYVGS